MKTLKFKNLRWKISLTLGLVMFTLPSCLDIWITTQIQPDGSLEQTIVFQGDSTEIANVNFSFINETDWKKEWTKPEKDKYKLVVSKKFKSVKELNKTMNPADTNLQVIRINATLHRKFRWFFTRYVYSETALEANPFHGLNYHDYLTDEDIRLLALTEEARKTDPGYDSIKYKVTDKNFEEYLFRSMYEDFHRDLLTILSEDKSFTLSRKELDGNKDAIFRFLIDSVKDDKTDDLLNAVGKVVKHPDIETIRTKYSARFDNFQKKMAFYGSSSDDNYKFAIRLPGLLLQSNSQKIKGAEAAWDLTYNDFFFKDYTMTAESRKVNAWAFIVAGLVVLFALGSLVAAGFRKR